MNKSHLWTFFGVCVLLVAAACGGGGEAPTQNGGEPAAPAASAPAVGGGTISGTIQYTGGDDPDTAIDMNADPNCQALHSEPVYTQRVETDGAGNLADVFVYVKSGISGTYPAPSEPMVLDQQGCQYHPHVFGIQTGQEFIIRNSDETLHNIHATPSSNAEFNQGQPFQNMELKKSFDQVEVMVPFKCDVHPWMAAYGGVLDHPFFAVTGADGSFSIANVPAGTYTVEAWHETFGAKTFDVTVEADGTADVSFDYAGGDDGGGDAAGGE